MSQSRRSDGAETHVEILDAAMKLASIEGLDSLSIGGLAREVGLSKSGLYAHFGSRHNLQVETLGAARRRFLKEVVAPASDASPGLSRLVAYTDSYLSYVERRVFAGGCFFAGMLGEFDARPGDLRDEVRIDQEIWLSLLSAAVEEARSLDEVTADTDTDQLVFEIHAVLELANCYFNLNDDPGVLDRARTSIARSLKQDTG